MWEWLLQFQGKMARAGRRVALGLHNFSAPDCAVKDLELEDLLHNIHNI